VKTIAALVVVVALVALAAVVLASGEGSTQGGLAVGVDADPDGNTATTLGAIDQCVSVAKDDTFSVDVFITDVTNLMAWEAYFSFDGSIVNLTDFDVELFQAANANSDVFNASEMELPSSGGLYRLGALDFESPDSGSGVLTRLTLKAVGAGISPAILITLDANNDGRPDLGTRLRDPQETPLGDSNGDEFFDGTVVNAQIAVDRDCPPGTAPTPSPSPATGEASPTAPSGETPGPAGTGTGTPPATSISSPTSQPTSTTRTATPSPTSTATPSSEDGGTDWNSPALVAAYVAAAAVATLAVGGLALLGVRRRSGGG
jgi:hypothetical protein